MLACVHVCVCMNPEFLRGPRELPYLLGAERDLINELLFAMFGLDTTEQSPRCFTIYNLRVTAGSDFVNNVCLDFVNNVCFVQKTRRLLKGLRWRWTQASWRTSTARLALLIAS